MIRHFLSISDLTKTELQKVLASGVLLKKERAHGKSRHDFKGRVLAMIFEKPSLRTRISFEAGFFELGGHAIYLGPNDIQMGKRESVADVTRTLERVASMVMARVFDHRVLLEMVKYAKVPVINALSDLEHPCQTLADLMTILEKKKRFKGLKLAFVGDGENNVTHSLALASGLLGMELRVASPKGFLLDSDISRKAEELCRKSGGKIIEIREPREAVGDADVVYTDTWISMGDEREKEKRLKIFRGYTVDGPLMHLSKKDAIFMHDLPAYRGNEVSAEVIDGPQSVVFDQAENRLHAQKALMLFLLKNSESGMLK
ncbi:MAG: ornithine carbamoyltransferase [Patescibacteria group bacterium]